MISITNVPTLIVDDDLTNVKVWMAELLCTGLGNDLVDVAKSRFTRIIGTIGGCCGGR